MNRRTQPACESRMRQRPGSALRVGKNPDTDASGSWEGPRRSYFFGAAAPACWTGPPGIAAGAAGGAVVTTASGVRHLSGPL